ncbi:MAG: hypothetical protein NW237_15560 [Cyanobacteriota bacterium]|nr:hypothetical protein [Cyanobacteriota bacterium]
MSQSDPFDEDEQNLRDPRTGDPPRRPIPPPLPSSTSRPQPREGQALAPRRPISRDGYSSAGRGTYGGYVPGSSRAASGYGGATVPETGSGRGSLMPSNLTVIALVALIAFCGGFVLRNFFTTTPTTFDEERTINADDVPPALREFCYAYNGLASFTVVELTSVSALTLASVPIVKLNTCTIPVSQTANALQQLGLTKRAQTLGPQLGGSNLTLIETPFANALAQAIVSQFPGIAGDGSTTTDPVQQVEEIISQALESNGEGLGLQNLVKTNLSNVYVMIPGHSFNLQPQMIAQ